MENPESIAGLLASMTPEIHAQLKEAVALGRWENGERLNEEQKALCLQAIIAYDAKFIETDQRVGYVKPKAQPCGPVAGKFDRVSNSNKGEH